MSSGKPAKNILRTPALNHWHFRPKMHDITSKKNCMHFDFHIYTYNLHKCSGDDMPYIWMCKPGGTNPQTTRLC